MNKHWKIKLPLLMLAAIPAFTGYPLNRFDSTVMPGITTAWLAYLVAANLAVLAISGRRQYAIFITVAALITLPVVMTGGTISYILLLAGWGGAGGQAAYSRHYVALAVTMLTVIPLALAMVAAVPYQAVEHKVFSSQSGVSRRQKYLLMFVRVFVHIAFFVIPNTLEILREERLFGLRRRFAQDRPEGGRITTGGWFYHLKHRLDMLIKVFIQIGIEGICSSIQYVPLWAVEISNLTGKEQAGDEKGNEKETYKERG